MIQLLYSAFNNKDYVAIPTTLQLLAASYSFMQERMSHY